MINHFLNAQNQIKLLKTFNLNTVLILKLWNRLLNNKTVRSKN